MSTLERAIEIAVDAHRGQKDKGGEPYILHPLRVMAQMRTNDARIVAVLHDVLEDGDEAARTRLVHAVDEDQLAALTALTRSPGEPYADYIERCAADPIAKSVKLADLFDNLDPERMRFVSYDTQKRLELKYLPARHRLLYGAWPARGLVDAALAEGA